MAEQLTSIVEPSQQLPQKAIVDIEEDGIRYVQYENETQLPHIVRLMEKDLSEPYSVYTYRYFINQWCVCCCS